MPITTGQTTPIAATNLSWLSQPLNRSGVLRGILLLICLCCPIRSFSATISGSYSLPLAWAGSPSPGVSYRIYYGTTSGNYTSHFDAGNLTTNTITGLASGTTYFLAVTAYDTNGLESTFSNEISFVPGIPTVQLHAAVNQPLVLKVSGLIGHTYDILASQDLVAWTVISTVTLNASASVNFTDPNAASFSQRFYRTQEEP